MVNVQNFQTLNSIPLLPKVCFLCSYLLKHTVERQTVLTLIRLLLSVDVSKDCWMSGNQCRTLSDAAFCCTWSGSILFASQACLSKYIHWVNTVTSQRDLNYYHSMGKFSGWQIVDFNFSQKIDIDISCKLCRNVKSPFSWGKKDRKILKKKMLLLFCPVG